MTDFPPLYDENLLILTSERLQGSWQLTCTRVAAATENPWAEATHLQLEPATFCLHGPAAHQGTWQLQRHAQLGQPFLILQSPDRPEQALVTRFRRSSDGAIRQMLLYFQSGLELLLTHP